MLLVVVSCETLLDLLHKFGKAAQFAPILQYHLFVCDLIPLVERIQPFSDFLVRKTTLRMHSQEQVEVIAQNTNSQDIDKIQPSEFLHLTNCGKSARTIDSYQYILMIFEKPRFRTLLPANQNLITCHLYYQSFDLPNQSNLNSFIESVSRSRNEWESAIWV